MSIGPTCFQDSLLMIEPSKPTNGECRDDIVAKLESVWHLREKTISFMGVHTCVCGARSDNVMYLLHGMETNSLTFHYLIYHREEVPAQELEKIRSLPDPVHAAQYKEKNNQAKKYYLDSLRQKFE